MDEDRWFDRAEIGSWLSWMHGGGGQGCRIEVTVGRAGTICEVSPGLVSLFGEVFPSPVCGERVARHLPPHRSTYKEHEADM